MSEPEVELFGLACGDAARCALAGLPFEPKLPNPKG